MKSPLITMSAITGKPTEAEIKSYMKSLKENGIDQIMLYPRAGCELEYLSDEWFEKIGEFVSAAKQLDMNLWLYDEFNWPSGDAGGRVTQIEEFRLKSITVKGENIGRINYNSTLNSSLFGLKFCPDLLSEKAVDYFIETTHEKYYEKFKDCFGSIIKGFYTDEPSVGYCCTETSIPYYCGIEDDYEAYFGRGFTEDLHNSYEYFFRNAYAVIADRFNKCYIKKISDWCEKHGVLMTGHLLSDDTPFGATKHSGNFLGNLSSFSLPGIDEIYTALSKETFTSDTLLSLLGGAEYASNEHGAMAELFALGPCDMSYTAKRCMIFLAACFKINHYFLAVSHMDIRGNMKIPDYFNDFTADQPDFGGTVLLSKDAKIAAQYAMKDFTPDVYIVYPAEICADHVLDNLGMNPFKEIINMLSLHQLQWKFAQKNDKRGNIPTIEFSDKMEYILDGTVMTDAEDVIGRLEKKLIVTDRNGDIPHGLFVRKYNDNTAIILNLYGDAGTYKIDGRNIYLDKQSVYISSQESKESPSFRKEEITSAFRLNYCNDNMIRAMYINSQTDFEVCAEADLDVCFAVRKGVSAYLADKKIECTPADNRLSAGLKGLYDISEPVKLKKGKIILKSTDDFKYMPSVFIIGDFMAQIKSDILCGVIFGERKQTYNCGEYLNYFGKIEYCADVTVPKDAKAVEIKGTSLYTCLFADNTVMGEKICSPYIFDVCEALRGKSIVLKVVQYSSIAPIFGDVGYFGRMSSKTKWKTVPEPTDIKFGFDEINWIF